MCIWNDERLKALSFGFSTKGPCPRERCLRPGVEVGFPPTCRHVSGSIARLGLTHGPPLAKERVLRERPFNRLPPPTNANGSSAGLGAWALEIPWELTPKSILPPKVPCGCSPLDVWKKQGKMHPSLLAQHLFQKSLAESGVSASQAPDSAPAIRAVVSSLFEVTLKQAQQPPRTAGRQALSCVFTFLNPRGL